MYTCTTDYMISVRLLSNESFLKYIRACLDPQLKMVNMFRLLSSCLITRFQMIIGITMELLKMVKNGLYNNIFKIIRSVFLVGIYQPSLIDTRF